MTPTRPAPGMVMSHVLTISWALPHRTALGRSDEPMPMIAEETTWVVETGAPRADALRMTAAEVSWVSRAWAGRTL